MRYVLSYLSRRTQRGGDFKVDEAASMAFLRDQVEKLKALSEYMLIQAVELDQWDVFVTFTRAKDGRKYTIRLRCNNGYPLHPPSVVFVNPQDHTAEGSQFWPDDGGNAFKKSSNPPFICIPGIREYHEHHREVQFTPRDVALSKMVAELVTMMNR